MTWKIPLFKIYRDEEDIKSVTDVIKRGSYWATGPEIQEFENKISEYAGIKYVVTFNSGTSALHTLLLAYDIKQGNEVIVPSFTFIATANAPLFVGAKPIFAEIEGRTYGLNPEDVKERITSKTKAIMPIHYGGCSCLIRELKEIAEDYNLLLIEDAAESLGAKIKSDKVGTFGDSAMLSFCQNKVITTGEGGAIVTDSKEVYEKLKLIVSHGRLETQDYFSSMDAHDYVTLGYNFRMPTMCAALGLSQLKKIDKVIKMRRDKAEYMTKKLSKIKEITLPTSPHGYFHVYQMYVIRIFNGLRNDLMKYLAEKGIMTKVYFPPIHLTHFYRTKFGYKGGELPVTEEVSNQVLSLPLYPTLTEKEIDYITDKINTFLGGK
ncbi:perosamine synthetase [Candidatus Methanophagaceae archaeon]|nr:perosamine synthetase [Methanophagales archaeon]